MKYNAPGLKIAEQWLVREGAIVHVSIPRAVKAGPGW